MKISSFGLGHVREPKNLENFPFPLWSYAQFGGTLKSTTATEHTPIHTPLENEYV